MAHACPQGSNHKKGQLRRCGSTSCVRSQDSSTVANRQLTSTGRKQKIPMVCPRHWLAAHVHPASGTASIRNNYEPMIVQVIHVVGAIQQISRIPTESHLPFEMSKLFQEYPDLKHLRRFHPSAELISHVMDALLTDNFVDPLQISRQLLANPGKITM